MSYFHYTSRKSAQDVICGLPVELRPGRGGMIYVSPSSYDLGCEAAGDLAILNEVEFVCMISEDRVIDPSPAQRVQQIMNPDGSIARAGGGWEIKTKHEIVVDTAEWRALDPP